MLETSDQILYVLDRAGEDLVFSDYTVRGIPGEIVYAIPGYTSPYDIERQDISFQLSTVDVIEYSIKVHDTFQFTPSNGSLEYTFEVMDIIDDYTGWTEVKVKYISRA